LRNAIIGSTGDARQAGTAVDSKTTTSKTAAATMYVTRSFASIPNSNEPAAGCRRTHSKTDQNAGAAHRRAVVHHQPQDVTAGRAYPDATKTR
jgi:hypothetical protein